MLNITSIWRRRLWFLPPVIIGLAVVFLAPLLKSGPEKAPSQERAAKVRVIKASKIDVLPRAVGYGTAEPGQLWNAVAEVTGPVAWVSPLLEDGNVITVDTELLRIDDTTYKLNLAQIEAQIEASKTKGKTTAASLAIAERNQKLLAADYQRKKTLAAKGAVSKAGLEAAERQLLAGETQTQSLKNTLAVAQAEREALESQREQAELDLRNTSIRAPYDVRLSDIAIDLAQSINKGQFLFKGDGIAAADIKAQFPIGSLRPLIIGRKQEQSPQPSTFAQGALGLDAIVRLNTSTHSVEWPARVTRVAGGIDPQTQSVGIVATIDAPYRKAEPGKRPPLARGTFVEMELRGAPLTGHLAIPVQAVHEGKIYVVDDDSRLAIRPVKLKFTQGGFAVVERGLKPGEWLVVTDLVPAVAGMLLNPVEDKKAKMNLMSEATAMTPEELKSRMQ